MPELLEIESYRALFEGRAIGRRIGRVTTPDPWYLKEGLDGRGLCDLLIGRAFGAVRRHGKLLLAEVEGGPVLGLRFGMTGRLLVDGTAGIDGLVYGSDRAVEAWDRVVVHFDDGGDLRIRDPRRLGGVVIEPDVDRLGPDATTVTLPQLREIVGGSRAPVKAVLMDQARVAGLGNLLVDDLLWRAGIDPGRSGRSLSRDEHRALHRAMRTTIRTLGRRGGSHTGDLQEHRRDGGRCPRDGEPLVRRTIGGRTTWSCPRHQA